MKISPGDCIDLNACTADEYNRFGALAILAGAEAGEFNLPDQIGKFKYFGWSKNHGLYHSSSMIEFDRVVDPKVISQKPLRKRLERSFMINAPTHCQRKRYRINNT